MIVVKVELVSAINGETTLLNSVVLDNIGGTNARGHYRVRSFRKGVDPVEAVYRANRSVREGKVREHPRLAESVLCLVRKGLEAMGY
jgi:hypothetical protein